jgi:hypothetical protein
LNNHRIESTQFGVEAVRHEVDAPGGAAQLILESNT